MSDNASADDVAAVVKSFDDFRVVHDRTEENIGLFGNLTRSLRLGSGRYRVVLHDDDLMLPGSLERKVRFLDTHPEVGFAHSAFRYVSETGAALGLSLPAGRGSQADIRVHRGP